MQPAAGETPDETWTQDRGPWRRPADDELSARGDVDASAVGARGGTALRSATWASGDPRWRELINPANWCASAATAFAPAWRPSAAAMSSRRAAPADASACPP